MGLPTSDLWMTPRREGKDPRGPFPDLPKTKKTDLWSADWSPQTIHFPSRKYRKNLTADKLGKRRCSNSDGENYSTEVVLHNWHLHRALSCSWLSRLWEQGQSTLCTLLHAPTLVLHPVLKQAPCSRGCAFRISLHCIEPTVDNW